MPAHKACDTAAAFVLLGPHQISMVKTVLLFFCLVFLIFETKQNVQVHTSWNQPNPANLRFVVETDSCWGMTYSPFSFIYQQSHPKVAAASEAYLLHTRANLCLCIWDRVQSQQG